MGRSKEAVKGRSKRRRELKKAALKAKKCRDIESIASDRVPTDSSATKSSTQVYDNISDSSDSFFDNSEDTCSTLADEQAVQPSYL